MVEEWVTHYPVTLRPKLNPRRFQADEERLHQTDLVQQNAYWGGEPAAEKLTRHLKPVQFTIYAREPIARLIAAARMPLATENLVAIPFAVELLDAFWQFEADQDYPDAVPPILAYADLLAIRRDISAQR